MTRVADNPLTTVIIANFYNQLIRCAQDTSPHNMLVIAGDFNARIGKDSHQSNPRVIATIQPERSHITISITQKLFS